MELIVIVIIFGVIWGFVCRAIAESKGRDKNLAFFWGFLFGLLAVIVYALMGKSEEARIAEYEKIAEAQARAKQKVEEEE
jgi:steroid 5-alpha reductase family enzyme